MSQQSITIKGSLDFIRASGILEFPPSYVFIYLDSFFEGNPLRLISADQNPGYTEFEITAMLPKGVKRVPRDARLVFQTYISTINDYGAICQEDTGMTSVEIYEALYNTDTNTFKRPLVMQTIQQHEFSSMLIGQSVLPNGNFKNELRIQTNRDVKGTLHIILDSIESSSGSAIEFDMEQNQNSMISIQPLMNMLQSYNVKISENLKRYTVNVKNTEQITCFWYPSNCTFGGGTTEYMMPLPAYLMSTIPTSVPEWWIQQLEIMADRQNFTSKEAFISAWPGMKLTEKATYSIMLFSQYVHALEYVSDRSSGKMIEMFGEALSMYCGDCEDMAKGLYKMKQSLLKYGDNNAKFSILGEICTIIKQYVILLCLEGVTATHTQNDTDFKPEIDGAHAAVKALPRDYFGECIARGNSNHILGQIDCAPAYKGLLPVLVGEGTGMLFPVGRIDGHEQLRSTIGEQMPVIRPIKKYLYNTPTDSKFYKQIMLGVTTEFLEDYQCASFYFSAPVENDTSKLGKGTPFTLLVQRSPLVTLYPLAFNPEVKVSSRNAQLLNLNVNRCNFAPEFTRPEIGTMKSVVRACVPPPIFSRVTVGPVVDRDMARIQHPLMNQLCENLKTMKQATINYCQKYNTIGANENAYQHSIQYFINPQYLSQKFVNDFIAQARRLNIVIGASYLLERHLDNYFIYRMTLQVIDTCAMGIAHTNPQVLFPQSPSTTDSSIIGNQFLWH